MSRITAAKPKAARAAEPSEKPAAKPSKPAAEPKATGWSAKGPRGGEPDTLASRIRMANAFKAGAGPGVMEPTLKAKPGTTPKNAQVRLPRETTPTETTPRAPGNGRQIFGDAPDVFRGAISSGGDGSD